MRRPAYHRLELRKITFLALLRNDLVGFVQRFVCVAVLHEEQQSVGRPVFATIVAAFCSHRMCRYQSCYGAVLEVFTRPEENKCLG